MTFELPESGDCVFCSIVAGNSEARWEVSPDGGVAADGASCGGISYRTTSESRTTVVCFHNQLKWARVMLLIVPVQHMTQKEFWTSPVLTDAASLAVEMGDKHCGADGYRVISNFGRVAHQSQAHGHIHVVSGTSRQIDDARKTPLKDRTLDADASGLPGDDLNISGLAFDEYDMDEVPFATKISPSESSSEFAVTQREFWGSDRILSASQAALKIGDRYSPAGYRLMSSFDPAGRRDDKGDGNNIAGLNSSGLFLLGGGQLGLYV